MTIKEIEKNLLENFTDSIKTQKIFEIFKNRKIYRRKKLKNETIRLQNKRFPQTKITDFKFIEIRRPKVKISPTILRKEIDLGDLRKI